MVKIDFTNVDTIEAYGFQGFIKVSDLRASEYECLFRAKSSTHSEIVRPPIPILTVHPFQTYRPPSKIPFMA